MRVLVTGGRGFIGRHLIRALLESGNEVVHVGRRPLVDVSDVVEYVNVDLANRGALEHALSAVDRCDAIFHFGAKMHGEGGELWDYAEVNAGATESLLRCAAEWNVNKFIYASSIGIVGYPSVLPVSETHEVKAATPYHVSKYMGEALCEYFGRQGLPTVSLRLTSPYGPGMASTTVIPKFLKRARESKPIILYGTGSRSQNFVHVSDVVSAALLALKSSAVGVFNIGGASSLSMKELAGLVRDAVEGSQSPIEYSGEADTQEDMRWDIALEKAERALGYQPAVSLPDGLKAMQGETL